MYTFSESEIFGNSPIDKFSFKMSVKLVVTGVDACSSSWISLMNRSFAKTSTCDRISITHDVHIDTRIVTFINIHSSRQDDSLVPMYTSGAGGVIIFFKNERDFSRKIDYYNMWCERNVDRNTPIVLVINNIVVTNIQKMIFKPFKHHTSVSCVYTDIDNKKNIFTPIEKIFGKINVGKTILLEAIDKNASRKYVSAYIDPRACASSFSSQFITKSNIDVQRSSSYVKGELGTSYITGCSINFAVNNRLEKITARCCEQDRDIILTDKDAERLGYSNIIPPNVNVKWGNDQFCAIQYEFNGIAQKMSLDTNKRRAEQSADLLESH